MKLLAVLLSLCAASYGQIVYDDLYPIDLQNDAVLDMEDGATSATFNLHLPIIFYDNVFNAVSVHTDGSITLKINGQEEEKEDNAIVTPYLLLDPATQGDVYYNEVNEGEILTRATSDVHRAFDEAASGFEAGSVLIVTWDKVGSKDHPQTNFTFQCVIVTDGLSSFVIFLYPRDAFAVGDDIETTREQLSGMAGFNGGGRDELETMSAIQLLDGGNPRPGEWIFQIGGILLSLDYSEPVHHAKDDTDFSRRESGFEVSEVNFSDDYGAEELTCGAQTCARENANCASLSSGQCCQCNENYTGNGISCIQEDQAVSFNGHVNGYSILMYEDNSWSNETADNVDLHSYVVTSDGRAFIVMNGAVSPELSRALQPMLIFGTTLGWMFAKTDEALLNGFQMSGGKVTSNTYIRYTTGQYEFRIRQVFEGISTDEELSGRTVFTGSMEFSGRLPAVPEGAEVKVDDYSQVYTRYGTASVRTEDVRSYTVGDTKHTYTIDQSIDFSSCASVIENEPEKSTVDVDGIYIEYLAKEANLRFAMNNYLSAVPTESEEPDNVGVRPTEAPEIPPPAREEQEIPEETETSKTRCEIQLEEAQRLQPHVQDEVFFPTCTDIGTYAPRQCLAYNSVCWCVDSDTGEEIKGTKTEPLQGYSLDCSDIKPPPESLTPCEEERRSAQVASSKGGPGANSIYMPLCMESGAYEPLQQLPDGSFMCVDFAGREVSRSTEQPRCLTSCQTERYIAEASNIFKKTNHFVVECLQDGSYKAKQCTTSYCYCLDSNGLPVRGTRVEIGAPLNCDATEPTIPSFPETPQPTEVLREDPVQPEIRTEVPERIPEIPDRSPPRDASRLMFAQSMGINIIDLPVSLGATSQRLFARSDQTAVALAYDCSTKVYYWTDVSKRIIYSADIDGNGARNVFVNDGIRSPEGIAVDFLSGNVYWTDSEHDRIEVAHADGSNRMTLVSGDMTNPRGIAVDPIRGRMYWTDWNRKSPKIWIADMDGHNKRVLVSDNLGLPNDITIDFAYRKVCFVDAGTKRVECMNFDGSGRETVYSLPSNPIQHPFGLAIEGSVLYYSTWRGSKVVHAVNWRTGSDVPINGPRGSHGQMFGVQLIPASCPRGYNQCMNNNGGCTHLCLPTPTGRECKCPPSATDC